MTDFRSDNTCGIHPAVMDAIQKANTGTDSSYGADGYSVELKKRLSDLFEKEVSIWLTNTGTAANSLALSSLVKPFQSVICHQNSHINTDECAAPEFFTSGARLYAVKGENGKMDLSQLQHYLNHTKDLRPHTSIPVCISVTQATECGTVYSLNELQKIAEFAKKNALSIHMDGARFANALTTLQCTPAEMTWKSGVDVLSLGGTKNGAMMAEVIVFFNQNLTTDFDFRHKRAGQLMSKMRFMACQWLALLENNLWINNALQANNRAKKLADIFQKYQFTLPWPVESNAVFVSLPKNIADALIADNIQFYDWHSDISPLYRFVTSCFTTEADLQSLEKSLDRMVISYDGLH